MSGNKTFKSPYFSDLRFSFKTPRVHRSPTVHRTVLLWKTLLPNVKQVILCSLSKEFVFSKLLTGEKSKNKQLREEISLIYKLIFDSIVFAKPVFINSNTNCLRPREIPWKVLTKQLIFSKVADFLTRPLQFFTFHSLSERSCNFLNSQTQTQQTSDIFLTYL